MLIILAFLTRVCMFYDCSTYFYGCRADFPQEAESRIHVSSRERCPHNPALLMLARLLCCYSSCVVGNKLVQDRE